MIIDFIRKSIFELEMEGYSSQDMIIAYSPIVERLLQKEAYVNLSIQPGSGNAFMGVQIYNQHPYLDEIVVYVKDRQYQPKSIKSMKLDVVNTFTIQSISNFENVEVKH